MVAEPRSLCRHATPVMTGSSHSSRRLCLTNRERQCPVFGAQGLGLVYEGGHSFRGRNIIHSLQSAVAIAQDTVEAAPEEGLDAWEPPEDDGPPDWSH